MSNNNEFELELFGYVNIGLAALIHWKIKKRKITKFMSIRINKFNFFHIKTIFMMISIFFYIVKTFYQFICQTFCRIEPKRIES